MSRIGLFCMGWLLVQGCAAPPESSLPPPDMVEQHLGVVDKHWLLSQYPEFAEAYHHYFPAQTDLAAMATLEGKEILVLFGTWCHDSVREVPRLLKLIDESGVHLKRLTLVAVDGNKSEPGDRHVIYGLRYTPTMILIEDGLEVTRIVERPRQSIARDFADAQAAPRAR